MIIFQLLLLRLGSRGFEFYYWIQYFGNLVIQCSPSEYRDGMFGTDIRVVNHWSWRIAKTSCYVVGDGGIVVATRAVWQEDYYKCLLPFVELPLCCDPLSQMVLIGDMAASQGPWLATLSHVQHRLWDHHWDQGATAKNTLKMVIWCYSVTFAGFLVPPICWAFLLFDSCRFRQDSQRSARRSSVDFGITTTEPKEGRQRSARRSSVDFAVTITEPKEDILEIWESKKKQWKKLPSCQKGICNLELSSIFWRRGCFRNKNLRVVQDNANFDDALLLPLRFSTAAIWKLSFPTQLIWASWKGLRFSIWIARFGDSPGGVWNWATM